MSYSEKIQQSTQKARSHAIANKILNLMDDLRLKNNEVSKRRWIWELLQNAKDVFPQERGVDIEINLTQTGQVAYLDFSHNGLPFSVDNITFLVEQVSTKDRDSSEGDIPKTTGRFGTGFLTTHLLSEIVEVNGVVKEPDLPFRKSTIILDRSGQNMEAVTKSVEYALGMLSNLDKEDDYSEYNPEAPNTRFRYFLKEQGLDVAKTGLEDLHTAIPYTLVFNPHIRSVHIVHEGIRYEIGAISQLNDVVQLVRVNKHTSTGSEVLELALLSKDHVMIAREVETKDGQTYLLPFDKKLPRLFCDFPLIGTEDLHLPVIVNSPLFFPTEPRNGIYLSDQSDERIEANKKLLTQGLIVQFISLIQFASENNWRQTYYLADIKNPQEKEWLSKSWFETAIVKVSHTILQQIPLIDTVEGERVTIIDQEGLPNVLFPSASRKEVREKIWKLAVQWIPEKLPAETEYQQWYENIWPECARLTIESMSNSIQNMASLEGVIEKTKVSDQEEAIQWLNEYYDLLNFEGEFINQVINDKYSIIPNQLGKLCRRSQVYVDGGIEEELKNVLNILGNNPRAELKHLEIVTKSKYDDSGFKITYGVRDQEYAITEINRLLQGNNANSKGAINHLISLFSDDPNFPKERELLYQFSKDLLGDEVPERRLIKTWSKNIWEESDKMRITRLAQEVSKKGNITALAEHLRFQEPRIALEWLERLINFILKANRPELLNGGNTPILPNQNGHFRIKDDLFLDDGGIDENLKDIVTSLGYDCRVDLLEKSIFLELPANRTKTQQDIANEINQRIRPLLSEVPRSETTRKIFKALFLWFNAHKEDAALIFDDLFKNRHRLYDDEEIAENMKKAEMLDDILAEQDVTIEDIARLVKKHNLKALIEKLEGDTQNEEPEPQTPDEIQAILIQLGITSEKELIRALADRSIAKRFQHIPSNEVSVEMFEYVMELIQRSKENVRTFLQAKPDYDTSGWHETSITVISGVKKHAQPVTIVVRPSDGGQVIFYYGVEKDALEQPNAELWTHSGQTEPQHLTLGKIIKRNNITRIEV